MNALLCFWLRRLLVLACVLPAVVVAAEVRGLYEGQVEVASEQESERSAAQGQALRQVLRKLSGASQVGGEVVEAAVLEPQRYLQQFSYRQSSDSPPSLTLWASFEVSAVDALLREAQLPVWSGQRPLVLVWLALASTDATELIAPDSGAGDEHRILAALQRRAWERGIPLGFPLLDLEDRVRIQATDVWQLDMEKVDAASQRYGSGVVLVGRVESDPSGAWTARWSMTGAVEDSQWSTRGLSAAATVPEAIDRIADRLAARYAVHALGDTADNDKVEVRVAGVRSLNDYARVLAYLNGLDQISGLVLRAARHDELRLRMQFRGGAEGLRRVVAFSDVLSVESEAVPREDATLSFRVLP